MRFYKSVVFVMLTLLVACSDPGPEKEALIIFEDDPIEDVGETPQDTDRQADTLEPEEDVGPDVEPDVNPVDATPSSLAVDGEACGRHSDCEGGLCLFGDDWPEGYCTTQNCQTWEDCASNGEDNRCLQGDGGVNFCVRMCESNEDCRPGYACSWIGRGAAICLKDPVQPIEPGSGTIELTCTPSSNRQVTLEYDISPDTVAYMVTPVSLEGRRISPSAIYTPSGKTIDMRRGNAFQSTPAELFGSMNPTIVPATAYHANQLESGRHSYVLQTDSREVCHYLLEEKTLGTRLDLDVYLVGVPGISAATASGNTNMQSVLAHFEEIFLQAGIGVGQVRFHDIGGADQQRYSVIRSEEDVMNLVSLSTTPSDILSMNIFFVQQFAFSDGGGTIGISMGLPGPAGLHGTYGSGVVFTSEYMNTTFRDGGEWVSGDDFTGIVLAHEVGHYLGLFHTSEQYGYSHDPLLDTPECTRNNFPSRCPDLGNLMFPFASIENTVVTNDQAWVIRVNPLTKN